MSAIRSPQPPPALTRSVEDYLKSVFHLTSQGGFATTSDIAEMLAVAPPSVSGMMKRLSETGLIEHVPYRGVQLTPQGRRAALQMIRRHRILESYLTSRLGYDWGDVHVEAERLEHAVSEKLIERQPFNGPTIVRLGDGTTRVVGQELALLLFCRPTDGE
ncbi:MAG TPA: metal-dependent transcriptional regulator [Gemmatimonadaceae bacterium]|nr:metal-dependent transcriptional regulator [Gemmatimonadaceae bacterium]